MGYFVHVKLSWNWAEARLIIFFNVYTPQTGNISLVWTKAYNSFHQPDSWFLAGIYIAVSASLYRCTALYVQLSLGWSPGLTQPGGNPQSSSNQTSILCNRKISSEIKDSVNHIKTSSVLADTIVAGLLGGRRFGLYQVSQWQLLVNVYTFCPP